MTAAPVTRPSLLIRLQDSTDHASWQEFTALYAPVIYRRFRQHGLQDADAGDLTQEVLRGVALGFRKSEYNPSLGRFRNWLFGIARHKLNTFLRSSYKHPQGTGDSATIDLIEAAASNTATEQWEEEYQHQLFAVASESVKKSADESTWEAFWQTAVHGFPAEDVAQALGMSIGSVYVAKSRIIARIRKQIALIEGDQT